jgi:hypothetical protein
MTALNGASTAMAYAAATDTSGNGTAQTRKGGPMIDNFALGLTHGLMMIAAILLLRRPDLDSEPKSDDDRTGTDTLDRDGRRPRA